MVSVIAGRATHVGGEPIAPRVQVLRKHPRVKVRKEIGGWWAVWVENAPYAFTAELPTFRLAINFAQALASGLYGR